MLNIKDGYILSVTADSMTNEIQNAINSVPSPQDGYGYRLRADTLEWELVELPQIEEQPTGYTEEQLSAMTNAELEVICVELGINPNKTKSNMIRLIMYKQSATD